jgi:hypothetical protein
MCIQCVRTGSASFAAVTLQYAAPAPAYVGLQLTLLLLYRAEPCALRDDPEGVMRLLLMRLPPLAEKLHVSRRDTFLCIGAAHGVTKQWCMHIAVLRH